MARKRLEGVRERTVEAYERRLRAHVLPVLGARPISSITGRDVETVVEGMVSPANPTGRPLSQWSIKGVTSALKAVLISYYEEFGGDRPAILHKTRTPRPKRDDSDPNSLADYQARAVLEQARRDRRRPWAFYLVFLGLTTGMRIGELLAVEWSDLDLPRGRIRVCRSVTEGVTHLTKRGSERYPTYTRAMHVVLVEWRQELLRTQHPGLSSGLVFPSRRSPSGHMARATVGRALHQYAKAAGLPFRFTPHGLRRTNINWQRQAGVDRVVLRDTVGHSSEAMTALYSTTHREEREAAVAAVLERLGRS